MNKKTKLFTAFIMASISALLIPVFAQWYYQKTGIYPTGFIFVWVFGGLASILWIIIADAD